MALPVLSPIVKKTAALPHFSASEPYSSILAGPQCAHPETAFYNEAANVISPAEREIGYASSPTTISYIMLLYVHLALSISSSSKPVAICIMGRAEKGVTLAVCCTYLTFGF